MDSGEDTSKKRQIIRESVDDEHPASDGAVIEKPKKLRKETAATAVEGSEKSAEISKETKTLPSVELPAKDHEKDLKEGEQDDKVPEKQLDENQAERKESQTAESPSKDDKRYQDNTKDPETSPKTSNSLHDEGDDSQQRKKIAFSTCIGDCLKTISAPTTSSAQHKLEPTANKCSLVEGQDLESALTILVGTTSERQQEKERISQNCYLTFRMGHAGDASRIANWYRADKKLTPTKESKTRKTQTEVDRHPRIEAALGGEEKEEEEGDNTKEKQETFSSKETEEVPDAARKEKRRNPDKAARPVTSPVDQESASSLELWLADGLGNEDMPPSLFALLAHVNYDKDNDVNENDNRGEYDDETGNTISSCLAAAALLTVSWEHSERLLRVEWLRVDSTLGEKASLIEKRMWLRLAALSLMSNCEMLVVDQAKTSRTQQQTPK